MRRILDAEELTERSLAGLRVILAMIRRRRPDAIGASSFTVFRIAEP